MKIFRVVPLDRKGEIDGNTWYTESEHAAMKALMEGHSVMVAEIPFWSTTSLRIVEG